jgi:hypothetical protein
MPKWYIPLLISTFTSVISRSLIVLWTDGKKGTEMIAPVALGLCVAMIMNTLAYTFRTHLLKAFVY